MSVKKNNHFEKVDVAVKLLLFEIFGLLINSKTKMYQ